MDAVTCMKGQLSVVCILCVGFMQVLDMVQGRDRRPELGYFRAMRLRPNEKSGGGCSPVASPRDEILQQQQQQQQHLS